MTWTIVLNTFFMIFCWRWATRDFENGNSVKLSYFGLSSKKIEKGEHPLISHTIANPLDSHYVFSVWTHVDSEKYGIGWVKCKVKDKNGDIMYEQYQVSINMIYSKKRFHLAIWV